MLDDIKKDAATRMEKCVQTLPGRPEEAAHRAGPPEPGRAPEGRLLRLGRAAAAGGEHRGRGRAHARGLALGEEHGAGDREGDPQVRPGADAHDRRHRDPHSDAAAHRGAPPRDHQGAAPGRRERARRGAQRAPRRHERHQGAAQGEARSRRTTSGAPKTRCRSSPTSTSPTSSSCWRPRKRRSCRSDGRTLPPSSLPRHVAIIMDGNGRWAAARGDSRARRPQGRPRRRCACASSSARGAASGR